MAIRTYHDFIIFTDDVQTSEDGKIRSFSVRIFDSPGGQGVEKEHVVVTQSPDLERWSRRLGRRSLDTDVEQQMELGARLADLLLPPYARELYQRSLAWLQQDEGLRLRLRLADELVTLPWEYVHIQDAHGERTPSGFLALDPRLSIVRHEAIAIPAEWFEAAAKRRVLVVMATPQPYADYPQLKNLPREQRLISGALGDVPGIDITYIPEYDGIGEGPIPGATVEDVRSALFESAADIFHFSGHGDFVESMGPVIDTIEGEGAIILADGHNQAVFVSGDRLAEIIRGKGVRLVILGCCEAAKRDIFNKWSSVAASLLRGRIPSVVAMQFTIHDDLASAFMGAFYQALVGGLTIDEAVALGRGAIRAKALGERTHVRDWGAPVLYLRTPGGRIFNPVTDREASQEAGRKSNQRFRLHQAWWEWMARDVTPSADQLQHLAKASETLELSAVQALLLLRSAVAIDASIAPWLARLRRDGAELLKKLDDPQPPAVRSLAEARQILRLDEDALSDRPGDVGPVAWSAVRHDDRVTRQTAALALTALPTVPDEGLGRLDRALRGVAPPWKRFARKAEVRGTLADGDPQIERRNAGLPPWDRGNIWFWRFRRRARRERDRIRALVFGAAVGAGVALGALRGLLGIPAGPLAMTRFAINLFWGALLGAAIGLGAGLAAPMLVGRRETPAGDAPPFWQGRFHPDRWADLLALLLGTLFFGVMHLLVGWFNGLNLSERAMILATGTLAGFGVNLALYGQPKAVRGHSTIGCYLRMAAAALPTVLAQCVILAAGHDWAATAITRTGAHIRDIFGRYPEIYRLIDDNQNVFSYLDAALVGILLTVGITIGWQIALKRQEKDRDCMRAIED